MSEVDPRELKAALELVARARDLQAREAKKVPQLGVAYTLQGGVGGFRVGPFSVVVQHDPGVVRQDGSVSGQEWFVRVLEKHYRLVKAMDQTVALIAREGILVGGVKA
jgi:hypothetical protein